MQLVVKLPAVAPKAVAAPAPAKTARRQVAPQPKHAEGYAGPKATGNLAAVISFALAQAGKPYVYGAAGPSAYDCSGLIMAAYQRIGVRLPHQSEGIARRGRIVPRSQIHPGDVLHWPGHVALALGGNTMVHASRAGQPVKVATIYGSPQVIRIVG